MDLLSKSFDEYFKWAAQLPAVYFIGLLRLVLTFGLPAVLTAMMFTRGNRSVFGQVLACVVGLLIAATIPAEWIEAHNRFVRGWIIALAGVVLLFLPGILAVLLVPNLGAQRLVRRALCVLLAVLLIAFLNSARGAP